MMRIFEVRVWAFVIALAAVLALGCRGDSAVEGATARRVAPPLAESVCDLTWISAHEFVYVSKSPAGYEVVHSDANGHRTVLDASQRISPDHTYYFPSLEATGLAGLPVAQSWILWTEGDRPRGNAVKPPPARIIKGCRLDGSGYFECQRSGEPPADFDIWSPTEWIEIVESRNEKQPGRVLVRRLGSSAVIRTIRMKNGAVTPNYIVSRRRAFSVEFRANLTNPKITEMDPEKGMIVIHQFTPRVPAHWEIEDVVFSPSGDRVAWQVLKEAAKAKGGRDDRLEIWVSWLDGTHLRQIAGAKMMQDLGKNGSQASIDLVRWLPDGRHLSYLTPDGLYVCGVP